MHQEEVNEGNRSYISEMKLPQIVQLCTLEVSAGGDRGAPRRVQEQRHLAEVVAFAQHLLLSLFLVLVLAVVLFVLGDVMDQCVPFKYVIFIFTIVKSP